MWPTLTRWLPSLLCLSEFLGARLAAGLRQAPFQLLVHSLKQRIGTRPAAQVAPSPRASLPTAPPSAVAAAGLPRRAGRRPRSTLACRVRLRAKRAA